MYHTTTLPILGGLVAFQIWRGADSLLGTISAFDNDRKALFPILDRHPSFHGGVTLGCVDKSRWVPMPAFLGPNRPRPILGWKYDLFGDVPFSALGRGGYRPDESCVEWGTSEVFLDSIDEVRRVCGFKPVVEKAPSKAILPGQRVVRKLIL